MNESVLWVIRFTLVLNCLFLLGNLLEMTDRPIVYRIGLGLLAFSCFVTLMATFFFPHFYEHTTAFLLFTLLLASASSFAWVYNGIQDKARLRQLHNDLKVYGLIAIAVLFTTWVIGNWVGVKSPAEVPAVTTPAPLANGTPSDEETRLQQQLDSARRSL